jgi:hypothetical protein
MYFRIVLVEMRDVKLDAELFENLVLAPAGVVPTHASNEIDVVAGEARPADLLGCRLPTPVELETPAVPANHRLGFDDDQGFLPRIPELGQPDPEDPIGRAQTRAPAGPLVGRELLSQGQILEDERLSSPAERSHHGGGEGQNRGHRRILTGRKAQ